eukprot:79076_1
MSKKYEKAYQYIISNNNYIIDTNFIHNVLNICHFKRDTISWKLEADILYSIIENEDEINTENIEIISHYYKYDFYGVRHISEQYRKLILWNTKNHRKHPNNHLYILEIADLYRKINNDKQMIKYYSLIKDDTKIPAASLFHIACYYELEKENYETALYWYKKFRQKISTKNFDYADIYGWGNRNGYLVKVEHKIYELCKYINNHRHISEYYNFILNTDFIFDNIPIFQRKIVNGYYRLYFSKYMIDITIIKLSILYLWILDEFIHTYNNQQFQPHQYIEIYQEIIYIWKQHHILLIDKNST